MTGVYKIVNPKGQIYIGASKDIRLRWYRHRSTPDRRLPKLCVSLEKYGYENHVFEVIEICSDSDLNEKERYYQEKYNVLGDNGLNCELVKTDERQRKMSAESIWKISESSRGRKQSEETVAKRVDKLVGQKRTLDQRKRISNSLIGKKMAESHKQKAIRNLIFGNDKLVLDVQTGIFYNNAIEAAKTTNYSVHYVRDFLRGKFANKTSLIYV